MRLATKGNAARLLVALVVLNEIRGLAVVAGILWAWFK